MFKPNKSPLSTRQQFCWKMRAYLRLPSVLVLGQIDPGDGAKWSEELLQICLTGVLRQICHTNGGIIISCQVQTHVYFILGSTPGAVKVHNGCMVPAGTPASTHLCGWAAWTLLFACLRPSGSGAHISRSCSEQAVLALVPLVKENIIIIIINNKEHDKNKIWWWECWSSSTRASRFVLVPSRKSKLLSQLLLHGAQSVLVWTAGGPMVTFANTTRHNLLGFQFTHGILILVLSIQVLQAWGETTVQT